MEEQLLKTKDYFKMLPFVCCGCYLGFWTKRQTHFPRLDDWGNTTSNGI